MRFFRFAAFLLMMLPLAAHAAPQVVPGNKIKQLLTGNTILGTWAGQPYRQYFDANGSTIFAQKSATSTYGEWRIDLEENLYESWWRGSGWSGYQVVEENGQYFWMSQKDGQKDGLQPFEVLDGQQLLWE